MVYWSASRLNTGTSPCCMLNTAMVWPVSVGTCGGVVSGDDRAIHLLVHLEELMDGVARVGVIRHGRAGHLEGTGRQRVDVGDAGVGAGLVGQPGAASAEQELVLRRQA